MTLTSFVLPINLAAKLGLDMESFESWRADIRLCAGILLETRRLVSLT